MGVFDEKCAKSMPKLNTLLW